MTAYRLASGGLIDRSNTIGFTFDGANLSGHAGDTLASALLANDRLLVGRSFKYHRPRGIVTAGPSEPNALVTIGTGARRDPNTKATVAELYDGLAATSQNRWPSLAFDIGAVNDRLSRFLSAGFYYKTFMWPAVFWEKVYEPLIRRAAGLGRTDLPRDPDAYEKSWAHCDLLVVGSGPAGLAAALVAARSGLRVILAEQDFALGGALLSETTRLDGEASFVFARHAIDELQGHPGVTLLSRTTVFGWYDDNVFGAVERVQKHSATIDAARPVERLWRIVAKHAILATGAEERPLVFGGNDRPGIMMASAASTYANRFGVAAGRSVAIFTNGSSGYRTAADLSAQGVPVEVLIDSRTEAADPAPDGVRVMRGGSIVDTKGSKRLRAVVADRGGFEELIPCDALAMSGGWSPVIHLACQRGGKPVWSQALQAFLAPDAGDGLVMAGAAAGHYRLSECFEDGARKAAAVVEMFGRPVAGFERPVVDEEIDPSFTALWHVPGAKSKAFVDFQNDVHGKDLGLALREGFGHVEHAKRYTTSGMATDQGKLGNINAIGILATMRGVSPAEVGTTTFRPFYTPVSFGALAGPARDEHAMPARRSPLHGWAARHGAVFIDAGLWYRSSWFPKAGEKTWRESVDREVRTVREHAGLCDVSTLGKIEVFGPDAAEFLNRLYCNPVLKLPVGKARYGLMLREDGMVYDDGTVSRLAEEHFLVTTTTAMAAGVLSHMEFAAQALWPELRVRFLSVSDQWAQMSIAGPKARTILQAVVEDDLSDAAFPFLAAREVRLKGNLKARLFRISFSGELAYELAVPASYGEAVADALMRVGAPHGLCAYGVEALNVLRIEKGHVTHAELDGRVTPDDAGLGRMMGTGKPDFIGKRLSTRFGLTAADRAQLVGLKALEADKDMRAGAHLLKDGAKPSTINDQGWVSSVCFSPTLGTHIALAFLKSGRERYGEKIVVWDQLRGVETFAEVCDPVFVDPENRKLTA
ncbi:sarcosine oxidase subunit alpha family protein [Shinella sp. 838]|uniref:sarcosine oxidase subunit alpha family protein n=2 Tax=Shinella TaxID=323620 RepID=UPI0003C559A6|nr:MULTISPECIES: sarcosine oxidase subunit alpha family protein [unclassified Shinella]EYR80874.1 sarcosine oxidase subunit alpha [Shinella sp. DD12]MCA0342719.1 sarcosine oxidase subunit alpha family protein [Pseudomonadota bacterium]MDG4669918.1 sarcosine oxidase subunit alpha family protein [Shinella sp. 838]